MRRLAIALSAVVGLIASLLIIAPAHAAIETLFGDTVPTTTSDPDANAVTVGTKITVKNAGRVAGVRFYKGAGNGGTHVGAIYSASGSQLAKANFSNETASGWQTLAFSKPVNLAAGAQFTAAVLMPQGRYAAEGNYAWPLAAPSLTGVAGVYKYGTRVAFPTTSFQSSNYFIDVNYVPDAAPSPTPTPTPTSTPTSTPTPTPTPTSTPTASGAFPDSSNTGVPTGTGLTPYTGPCTITAADTIIDSKTVNCDVVIQASGVLITKSKINGNVFIEENAPLTYSFTVEDSNIDAGDRFVTAVGTQNFTVRRSEVIGGNRSAHCWITCLIEDSYFHGQMTDEAGVAHESGIRMGKHATLRHNTIKCTAPEVPPDAGCSGALTGYGDFADVQDNLMESNLFSSHDGYCVYGGGPSAGKPYTDTRDIRFIGNRWEKTGVGATGRDQCGWWGPVTSFDSSQPGNVWTDNAYLDGEVIAAAN